MADHDSTAVGFRIRGIAPTDLSTYPNQVKRLFWTWVTETALRVKDRELSRGWDKDGKVHPLAKRTIKYRKSEVGPVTKTAPRLIPALALSRVRSLLTGRAHRTRQNSGGSSMPSPETRSPVILHYAAEAGHDVFGISPRGTAQVKREAIERWEAWKVQAGHARPSVSVPGFPAPRQSPRLPSVNQSPRSKSGRACARLTSRSTTSSRECAERSRMRWRSLDSADSTHGANSGNRVQVWDQTEGWGSNEMITIDVSDAALTSDRVVRRLRSIAKFMKYAGPLMASIERRIEEGNRKGVLAGLDKDGNPAPPLTYRPRNARPMTVSERLGQRRTSARQVRRYRAGSRRTACQ